MAARPIPWSSTCCAWATAASSSATACRNGAATRRSLEEDIALANVALDLIGQARFWLALAGEVEGAGRDADELAYLRDARAYRNLLLVEQPNGDFAVTMTAPVPVRRLALAVTGRATESSDRRLADIAAKAIKEVTYHLERSRRLGDPPRRRHRGEPPPDAPAVDRLWPFTGELFAMDEVDRAMVERGIGVDLAALRRPWLDLVARHVRGRNPTDARPGRLDAAGRQARPAYRASGLSAGRDAVRAARLSGGDLVSDAAPPLDQVWAWLGEVPDPEIPAISVVDLGIVRDVEFDGPRARRHGHADLFRLPGHRRDRAGHRGRPPCAGRRPRPSAKPAVARPGPPTGSARPARKSCAPTASPRRSARPQRLERMLARQPLAFPARAAARPTPQRISEFGSTPCKAQYRCRACLEPFDYFKCH